MRFATASWLSFAGAWQRVRLWASRISNPITRLVLWPLGIVILLLWWLLIAFYYVLWLVLCPIVFIVMIPWRLLRRSHRQEKAMRKAPERGTNHAEPDLRRSGLEVRREVDRRPRGRRGREQDDERPHQARERVGLASSDRFH
jgi:hypothetical protein